MRFSDFFDREAERKDKEEAWRAAADRVVLSLKKVESTKPSEKLKKLNFEVKPRRRFSVGDEVEFQHEKKDCRGFVCEVPSESSISLVYLIYLAETEEFDFASSRAQIYRTAVSSGTFIAVSEERIKRFERNEQDVF